MRAVTVHWSRRPSLLAASVWAYAAVFVVWRASDWGADAASALIQDAAFVVPGVPAVVLGVLAWRRCADARTRSAWRWLTAASVLLTATFAAQLAYQAASGSVPFPSAADGCYLGFNAAFLIGLFRFPKRPESRAGQIRLGVDVAIIVIAGASVIWFLVLGPTVLASGQGLLTGAVASSYPIADLLAIFALAYVMPRIAEETTRRVLLLLMASTLLAVLGDLTTGWMNVHSDYTLNAAVAIAYIAAWACLVLAPTRQGVVSGEEQWRPAEQRRADRRPRSGFAAWVPYLAPVVVFGLLIYAQWNGDVRARLSLAIGAALVAVFVLLRQYLVRRDLLHDIALREQLETELRLAQKLESVGQLAAGVAHEINTPIQYVRDSVRFIADASNGLRSLYGFYAQLRKAVDAGGSASADLLEELDRAVEELDLDYVGERLPNAVSRSLDGLDRVANIVAAMRAFAHPPTNEVEPVDLNEAIRTTLAVCANEYKYVADVETHLSEVVWAQANNGDVNQLLLNVIVNAAQAIGDHAGEDSARGKIVIGSRAEGEHAVIEVADTGGGIPGEIAERVFDPFFTTKEIGRGTGQGLAIARTIVTRHRGTIRFETRPGRGTTFIIRLPAASLLEQPLAA